MFEVIAKLLVVLRPDNAETVRISVESPCSETGHILKIELRTKCMAGMTCGTGSMSLGPHPCFLPCSDWPAHFCRSGENACGTSFRTVSRPNPSAKGTHSLQVTGQKRNRKARLNFTRLTVRNSKQTHFTLLFRASPDCCHQWLKILKVNGNVTNGRQDTSSLNDLAF